MTKIFRVLIMTVFFSVMTPGLVFATATIDKTNVQNGIISVKYTGSLANGIKAVVEKDGARYIYTLTDNNAAYMPLQMGTGKYTVSVMENVGGNKYKPLKSESVSADVIDENAMYSASMIIVDYSASTKAIPAYKTLAGTKTGEGKAKAVYEDIVENYSYDFDKAKNISNDYVPVIDGMYTAKKGICYDYAALLAGALRSQGLPTRLIMGYAPDITEYHAWNQVLLGGKWMTVDTTYDAQMAKANLKYVFSKDSSKYKIVKIY